MLEMRKITALVLLILCAYTDIREQNIYVIPVMICAFAGTILTAVQILSAGVDNTSREISEYLIFPLILCIAMLLYSVISNNMIGSGDGLLCGCVGLILGIGSCLRIILYSSILCGAFAVVILTDRKIKPITRIPWAPFLLAGGLINITGALP